MSCQASVSIATPRLRGTSSRSALDDRPQPIPASAWLETSVDVEIVEHSICSHERQAVLSLLWVPERVAGPLGMIV
jgi:hypothetical protein